MKIAAVAVAAAVLAIAGCGSITRTPARPAPRSRRRPAPRQRRRRPTACPARYTNFNSGEYNVSAGENSVGAVTFQLPLTVKVAQIELVGQRRLRRRTR
jgi:hypothetical protein